MNGRGSHPGRPDRASRIGCGHAASLPGPGAEIRLAPETTRPKALSDLLGGHIAAPSLELHRGAAGPLLPMVQANNLATAPAPCDVPRLRRHRFAGSPFTRSDTRSPEWMRHMVGQAGSVPIVMPVDLPLIWRLMRRAAAPSAPANARGGTCTNSVEHSNSRGLRQFANASPSGSTTSDRRPCGRTFRAPLLLVDGWSAGCFARWHRPILGRSPQGTAKLIRLDFLAEFGKVRHCCLAPRVRLLASPRSDRAKAKGWI